MALFGKNPNEAAYAGGKKHFTDVIKNSGPGELLIWRQPEEDFNTNSTLIVMPGEVAMFIKGGNLEQVFGNGTYKLSTQNYPFISRLRNAMSGGISTFNCVVYFVRNADSEEIRWGTDSPIQVRDKVHGIRTEARVRGAYKLRISNPVKFLEKLVGNNIAFQTQEDMNRYFAVEFQGKIKSAVSKFLNGLEQELIGIEAYMDDLSASIEPYIDESLSDYGLKCAKFVLAGLDIDTSKYDKFDDVNMEAYTRVKLSNADAMAKANLAMGDKAVFDTLGENWGKQQAANILRDLANNPGAGGVGAMGAGMGMGMAAGSVFGNMANQMFAPVQSQQPAQQPMQQPVQQPMASGRFAPKVDAQPVQQPAQQPAQPQQAPAEDPFETLSKLKRMLDAGLIPQERYDAKVDEIMSRM